MNMSHCRFRNTLSDLRDCAENLYDDDVLEVEAAARQRLIEVCREIVAEADRDADRADSRHNGR